MEFFIKVDLYSVNQNNYRSLKMSKFINMNHVVSVTHLGRCSIDNREVYRVNFAMSHNDYLYAAADEFNFRFGGYVLVEKR